MQNDSRQFRKYYLAKTIIIYYCNSCSCQSGKNHSPGKLINLREFLIFHIQIIDDCVFFKYLVPRGEAYDKKYKEILRNDDK